MGASPSFAQLPFEKNSGDRSRNLNSFNLHLVGQFLFIICFVIFLCFLVGNFIYYAGQGTSVLIRIRVNMLVGSVERYQGEGKW